VIVLPPVLAGAVNATLTAPLAYLVAVPIVGAPGTVYGVAELLAELAELVPIEFVAVTVNVYAVPLVKPDTVIGLVDPVAVILPGEDVTVYPVIALRPVFDGAVNETESV
jgi:hypothetical protein